MKKFDDFESIAAVINEINIDTDAIIPKQFLKTIERSGLGKFLFYEKRYDNNNSINLDFILNKAPWRSSKILIAGRNFGCGSSREHAPWALLDFGFRCIIAPSFADIFYNNSIKNGLLLITLSKDLIGNLSNYAMNANLLKVSLIDKKIYFGKQSLNFKIENEVRERLLNGHDDIQLTLEKNSSIKLYEEKKYNKKSWKLVGNEN